MRGDVAEIVYVLGKKKEIDIIRKDSMNLLSRQNNTRNPKREVLRGQRSAAGKHPAAPRMLRR